MNNEENHIDSVMYFNISILGNESLATDLLSFKVNHLFESLTNLIEKENIPKNGFDGSKAIIQCFFSPITGSVFSEQCIKNKYKTLCVSPNEICTKNWQNEENKKTLEYSELVEFDIPDPYSQRTTSQTIKWMIAQSDLLLALWDGSEDFFDGKIWDAIQLSSQFSVPVIWINPTQPEIVYWSENKLQEIYNVSLLEKYIHSLFSLDNNEDIKMIQEAFYTNHKSLILDNFYSSFVKIFSKKSKNIQKDYLPSIPLPDELKKFDKNEKMLIDYYQKIDEASIISNNKYRSLLLLRAFLPFIANLSLAIGFYAKNIAGYFFDQVHLNWEWLAAIGFVLQASSNFFISFLSDRSNRKGWQKIFINQRYLAEYLRSALYFMPFSIPIKDQSFDLYDRDYQSTIPVFHKARNIIRNGGINSIQYGAYDYKTLFFDYFNRLLTSQIEYHENNAKKYKTIFYKLNKTGWFFFWLGFMIVIARALLQVIIQNVDLNQWIGSKTIWINSVESIIQGQTFLISFANMLAMMIPAIAALFFGINAITGFKNLFITSEDVLLKLYRIQKIAAFEETRKQTSFEDMSLLATQLMQVLFDETNDWHSFFSTKSINKN